MYTGNVINANVHLTECQGTSTNSNLHTSMDTTTEIVTDSESSSTTAVTTQEDMGEVVKHKSTRKQVLSSDDDEEEANTITKNNKPAYSLEKLPQIVSKFPKDEKPFPDPFPLPANFRSDVVAALASKSQTTKSFMTTINWCSNV